MQGHTHEIAALAAAVYTVPLIINEIPSITSEHTILIKCFIFVGASAIGGLLPDADMPTSTIGHKLLPLMWPAYLLRSFLRLMSYMYKPLKKVVKTLGHRGISHTPFLWFVLTAPIYLFIPIPYREVGRTLVTGIITGIISHLGLDFISGGIPLFFPVSLKRVKPKGLHIKTGGLIEKGIVYIITAVLCIGLLKFLRI